ncbi:MAG: GNAT family N-acetyltransferase [Brumimicrobium sp.]
MIEIQKWDDKSPMSTQKFEEINQFLYKYLQEYGDPKEDIANAMCYSLNENKKETSGFVLAAYSNNEIVGAAVINETGMGGYIPENILVYIATHAQHRGKGIGKSLMEATIQNCKGAIALHVEPDNPAKKLYEKIGFKNKYLEMRYIK